MSAAGIGLMASAMAVVGSTVVASKIIGDGMSPFLATLLRFAIATPIFVLLAWKALPLLRQLSLRDWGLLAAQAAAGSVAYTVLLIIGTGQTSAANASVIIGTLPMVMGVLAVMVFGEVVTKRLVASVALAGAGVLIITISPDAELGLSDLLGLLLVFGAVLCEATFLLLNKKLQVPLPAILQSTVMSGCGLLLSAGPAFWEVTSHASVPMTEGALLGVLYYALVPTILGFLLWYAGAERGTAGQAAVCTAVLPVSAILLSALVLGEQISTEQMIGCVGVVAAIAVGSAHRTNA